MNILDRVPSCEIATSTQRPTREGLQSVATIHSAEVAVLPAIPIRLLAPRSTRKTNPGHRQSACSSPSENTVG